MITTENTVQLFETGMCNRVGSFSQRWSKCACMLNFQKDRLLTIQYISAEKLMCNSSGNFILKRMSISRAGD